MQDRNSRDDHRDGAEADSREDHLELPLPLFGGHFKLESRQHNAADQPQGKEGVGDDRKPASIVNSCGLEAPCRESAKEGWTLSENGSVGGAVAQIDGEGLGGLVAIVRFAFKAFGTDRIDCFRKFRASVNQAARRAMAEVVKHLSTASGGPELEFRSSCSGAM